MLFNSYEFILFFLPVTVAVFHLLSRHDSRLHCLGFLAFASLFFYGWWNPSYLILISASMVANFMVGSLLRREGLPVSGKYALLFCGVLFNIGLLGYYKYGGFVTEIYNDLSGHDLVWGHVVLPLAISFFTFQQIAFLVDSAVARVERSGFLDYVVFVTFFPQLIAGPIVHHKEMMPQFRNIAAGVSRENLQVGLALFAIGLFKKTMLADPVSDYVAPIYDEAASGQITFLQAWIASLGFTLQIYFDFSGYSDMALGAARMFGIVLPVNFNSPLKASSIIDFWNRWHITLTRFLTAYIFTPLSIKATRKAMLRRAANEPPGKAREFMSALALPTMLTMFLSGVWHGAGYQFVVWGCLHGMCLVINHAWRMLLPLIVVDKQRFERRFQPAGVLLTLLSVCFAMLFFRADDFQTGMRMATALVGYNGVTIPEGIFVHLGGLQDWLSGIGIAADTSSGSRIAYGGVYCAVLLVIALFFPNSLDMLRGHRPALGYSKPAGNNPDVLFNNGLSRALAWKPGRNWAILTGGALAVGLMSLQGLSVFLYWQF